MQQEVITLIVERLRDCKDADLLDFILSLLIEGSK